MKFSKDLENGNQGFLRMFYVIDSIEEKRQFWCVCENGKTVQPFVKLDRAQAIAAAALLNTGASLEFAREAVGFNR